MGCLIMLLNLAWIGIVLAVIIFVVVNVLRFLGVIS